MNVARINYNQWAISSRGFNSRFANKLLVLIDGRSVYSHLFSGVYWDQQDVVLDDLDRIEVIRGPGATLWGSNAVNGVINVVTKSAKQTQGLLVDVGGGTYDRAFTTIRYGGKIKDDIHFRVFAKYANFGSFKLTDGSDGPDDWDLSHAGFRVDGDGAEGYTWTVQGDMFYSDRIGTAEVDLSLTAPYSSVSNNDGRISGGNLLAKLKFDESAESGWSLQGYFDRYQRSLSRIGESYNVFDVDFRHRFPIGDNHRLIWGVGYRHIQDDLDNSFSLSFMPDHQNTDQVTAFIQDTITLLPDKLTMMIGSKFEYNDYTGFEFQPSIRLSWTPDEKQTIWGAVSRAVRTPSRSERDVSLVASVIPPPVLPMPTPVMITGNHGMKSEDLLAIELGYRVKVFDSVVLDIASFYNHYEDLSSLVADPANPFNQLITNSNSGDAVGFEISSTWAVKENWQIRGAYTYLHVDLTSPSTAEKSAPQNQFNIRSTLNVKNDLDFNTALYFVDRVSEEKIDAYFRLDVGVTWRVKPNVECYLWFQNLLDENHGEFGDPILSTSRSEVPRSVYLGVKIRF